LHLYAASCTRCNHQMYHSQAMICHYIGDVPVESGLIARCAAVLEFRASILSGFTTVTVVGWYYTRWINPSPACYTAAAAAIAEWGLYRRQAAKCSRRRGAARPGKLSLRTSCGPLLFCDSVSNNNQHYFANKDKPTYLVPVLHDPSNGE
jgi:hypothetical protein